MTTLDELFRGPPTALDPRLRQWKSRLDGGGTALTLDLFRSEIAIGLSQPEMNLHFTKDGRLLSVETLMWDDDLNAGLVQQLHVRATSPEQEAERFALSLRAALRKPGREFGDGYLSAVLIEFLRDSDLTR